MNTELENRMQDWWDDHLGRCGTCDWKKRKYCTAIHSDAYGEEVENKDFCGLWKIRKGASL